MFWQLCRECNAISEQPWTWCVKPYKGVRMSACVLQGGYALPQGLLRLKPAARALPPPSAYLQGGGALRSPIAAELPATSSFQLAFRAGAPAMQLGLAAALGQPQHSTAHQARAQQPAAAYHRCFTRQQPLPLRRRSQRQQQQRPAVLTLAMSAAVGGASVSGRMAELKQQGRCAGGGRCGRCRAEHTHLLRKQSTSTCCASRFCLHPAVARLARPCQQHHRAHPRHRTAFIPFLVACDPDPATTVAALKKLDEVGADVIELGVPYSVSGGAQ